jgi:hypothetical protein
MMLTRRSVTVGSAALATSAVVLGPEALAAPRRLRRTSAESGQTVLDWERIAFRTLYTDTPVTPIPVGVPILGFVSNAMHHAAQRSAHLGSSSESAAVAQAAHDVLVHYYPAFASKLDADLATTFGVIGAGHERTKGARIGADAGRDMVESRRGDGYLDTTIHYGKTAGAGVWTPNPPNTDMLAAWLGSVRPLYVEPVPVSGPFSLGSSAWAADYEEALLYGGGGATPTQRSQTQTDTAVFFDSNSATMVGDALVRYLESHPIGILGTARLFAMVHGAMTDALINCWMLKRDVGFWRPFQAISGAYDDTNGATTPQPGWTPLRTMPNYSDYVSGHGCLTGPAVQVIRRTLGETAQLELRSVNFPNNPRTYARLTDLEFDAFHARIWGGFHFRKAMTDAYEIAHRTADAVMAAFDE